MTTKKTRIKHSPEFKAEALKLADKVGVAATARQLSLHESQIYGWRKNSKKDTSTSQREQELTAEVAKLKRQLAEQAEELEIGKKGRHLLREESKVDCYEFMLEHLLCFSIVRMAKVFGISRSGFYYWIKHRHNAIQREAIRQQLDTKVKEAFDNSKGRDGSRRIQKELSENGERYNVKTIAASMKRQDLTQKAARKFKCTTDSKHQMPVAPNLLAQNFSASAPNEKWAGDITYIATSEGWLYLAVIIDLYSRQVIGWSMDTRMTATLVCDALSMALFRRGFPEQVIVHSDRGSQYCSKDYRDLITAYNLKQSMSRKGNCWDNACVESFFHSMKVEAIQNEPIMTRDQMRHTIFEYIEVDYNRTRRHSALGYLSPVNFEQQNVA
ncbi:IS3 family transposase [Vibrio anguillarum]|uniref:IS3 family transposase n=11 Tax=Vibrio TaxID=662 RepID=A0AAW4ANK7_VIBAN|nr:IS3 family transposase [Vibrio anguillarum]ASF93693.1 IS3 family transposase [Vibrio anguillarum]ATA51324.1 IS3 family transposase [Vibrio anguillarum]AXN08498.1 IS3 family transposase [Vibrio anguillarum]AXN11900.1 IS3 family transposase [Vibrio anguillarum]AXN15302.1 IS3 family transposase [Vibrio anguillarum]